jgi:hypothetical protein
VLDDRIDLRELSDPQASACRHTGEIMIGAYKLLV